MSFDRRSLERLLFFIESGGPGGAERVVSGLAVAMRARGIDAAVLTLREGWLTETLDQHQVPRFLEKSDRSFDIGLPIRIAKLIRKHDYQVLHSHLLDSNFYGALAARIAGVHHVATEHGDIHHTSKKRFLKFKTRTMRFLGSQCTAVSSHTGRRWAKLGHVGEQIRVVPNPVFSPPTKNQKSERASVRRELGIEDEYAAHWLWFHVANLRPVKHQQTLLMGFANALTNSPIQQTLAIVGDGEMREELENLVVDLGIEERVLFLGHRNDVNRLLCSGDGFVLSSLSEAFPMSLLEAGAAGLFLVSSDVGGVRDILDDATSWLYPAKDAVALGAIMHDVVSDVEGSKSKAERSEQRILEEFSLDRVVDEYLRLYGVTS